MVVEKFRVTSELNFTKNNIFYYNLKTIKASAILFIIPLLYLHWHFAPQIIDPAW